MKRTRTQSYNPFFGSDEDDSDGEEEESLMGQWNKIKSNRPRYQYHENRDEDVQKCDIVNGWREQKKHIGEEMTHNFTGTGVIEDMEVEHAEVTGEAVETAQEDNKSIFFKKTSTADDEILQDKSISDLLSLLCLENGIRHIEVPTDVGTMVTSKQKFTVQDFKDSVRVDEKDEIGDLDMEDMVLDLMSPENGTWDVTEFVCCWASLIMVRPLKLMEFFNDPDEISNWFWELHKRGANVYNRMIYSEHVRGWTPLMLLLMLEAMFMMEFGEFVRGHVKGRGGNTTDMNNFMETQSLVSMKFAFNSTEYTTILSKMGIVPFPSRAPHLMDLWDIGFSLTTIAKAWRSRSFWFGYTLSSSKVSNRKSYAFGEDPLSNTSPFSSTSKETIDQVYWQMRLIEKYMYWLRRRFIHICTNQAMDPKHTKVKEHLFYITGMFGLIQTFVNLYLILYAEKDGALSNKTSDLKSFTYDVYGCDKPEYLSEAKTREKIKIAGIITSLPDTAMMGKHLVHECLEISKQGAITDEVVKSLQVLVTPVHTNLYYHSRSGGGGVNIKMALRETLPRSASIIQREFMDIVGGSDKEIRAGMSTDMVWCVDLVLQMQGIDACIGQFSPSFKWSEKYVVFDKDLPCIMTDLRQWPQIDEEGCAQVPNNLLNKLGLVEYPKVEGIRPSNILFKCPDDEYRDITIVVFGAGLIVHGYGHVFYTTSMAEAFIAWSALKDAYEGWVTPFYIDFLGEDKNIHRKLSVCNLEAGVQYILQSKYLDNSVFQQDIDESMLQRLSHRMGDDRRDNRKGLSVADVEGSKEKSSEGSRSADGNKSVQF